MFSPEKYKESEFMDVLANLTMVIIPLYIHIYIYVCVCVNQIITLYILSESESHSVVSDSLQPPGLIQSMKFPRLV